MVEKEKKSKKDLCKIVEETQKKKPYSVDKLRKIVQELK